MHTPSKITKNNSQGIIFVIILCQNGIFAPESSRLQTTTCSKFTTHSKLTVELQNDYVLGFIIREIFTVSTLQDWVGWGIFTVIPGYPRRANGDSQHLETRPELQGWLRSE